MKKLLSSILGNRNIEDNSFFKFQVWHKVSSSHYDTTLKDFGIENNLQIHLGKECGLLGGGNVDSSSKRKMPEITNYSLIQSTAKRMAVEKGLSEEEAAMDLLLSPTRITYESNGSLLAQQIVDDMDVKNDDPEGHI